MVERYVKTVEERLEAALDRLSNMFGSFMVAGGVLFPMWMVYIMVRNGASFGEIFFYGLLLGPLCGFGVGAAVLVNTWIAASVLLWLLNHRHAAASAIAGVWKNRREHVETAIENRREIVQFAMLIAAMWGGFYLFDVYVL